ncbi:MAG: tetratricopeptide repeat protein [bacterium]
MRVIKANRSGARPDDHQEAKRYYFKAQDALKAGKWIKAIDFLKTSVRLKEDYQPAYRDLAEIFHQHGDTLQAREYIKKSLRINPQDPVSLFTQGVILLSLGELQSALNSFQRVMENGDITWGLAYNIGLCYYGLKDFSFSIDYLSQAIQKDPSQTQPYLLLAQIYILQNKADKAGEVLMRAKRMRPQDKQLDVLLSNILDLPKNPGG